MSNLQKVFVNRIDETTDTDEIMLPGVPRVGDLIILDQEVLALWKVASVTWTHGHAPLLVVRYSKQQPS